MEEFTETDLETGVFDDEVSDLSGAEPADDPAEVRMYFIYSISGFGKQYIGSTCDYNRRMANHKYRVPRRDTTLYRFILENGGWDLFQKTIIESREMTSAEALTIEKDYIKNLNSELNTRSANHCINSIDMAEFHRLANGIVGKERIAIRNRMLNEVNRERKCEQRKEWNKNNPEKMREYQRAFYARNREKVLAKQRAYHQRIREQKLATDPSKGPVIGPKSIEP